MLPGVLSAYRRVLVARRALKLLYGFFARPWIVLLLWALPHRDFHLVSANAFGRGHIRRRNGEGPGQSEEVEVEANPTDLWEKIFSVTFFIPIPTD